MFAAVLATAALTFRNSLAPQQLAVAGKLPRQEKIVQRLARQAEESRLPFLLVTIPVTVLLLLLQD